MQSKSLLRLFPFCLLLAACTSGQESIGIRPNPASVSKIGFRFAEDFSAAEITSSQRNEMAARIGLNLGGWGYPVSAGEGDYSHILEARVGQIEHKSTPTGFSFSVGNSDPRAAEFQQADVLPIDCVLYPAGRPKATARMYMDFMAGYEAAPLDVLVNHVGTVCFNLLSELKIPRIQAAPAGITGSTSLPSWMPEVRIEVVEKPAPGEPVAPAANSSPVPKSDEKSTPSKVQSNAEPESSIQTESRTGEGRKQIIIHNQGAPVILEFGYERK
jgi:hypothetical protein